MKSGYEPHYIINIFVEIFLIFKIFFGEKNFQKSVLKEKFNNFCEIIRLKKVIEQDNRLQFKI
jgi:hypothetical protein